MNLNANRQLLTISVMLSLQIITLSFISYAAHRLDYPSIFVMLIVLFAVGSLVMVIISLRDLIVQDPERIQAKVVNKEQGNIIHVLREDGKLKKYRIMNSEVLNQLEADQQIEILLTRVTRIPADIKVVSLSA